jgi:hypothetical protein
MTFTRKRARLCGKLQGRPAKHASASMAEPIKDPVKRTGAAAPLLPVAKVSAEEPSPQFSTVAPPLDLPEPISQRIDKSALPLGEPKRIRDKEHLKFVARHPCLVCGRQPSDAHHLRFAQPRALGMKVSHEFTVPLCRTHHRNLHQTGNELAWWETARVEPLPIARSLWETSHPRAASRSRTADPVVAADQTNPTAAVGSVRVQSRGVLDGTPILFASGNWYAFEMTDDNQFLQFALQKRFQKFSYSVADTQRSGGLESEFCISGNRSRRA